MESVKTSHQTILNVLKREFCSDFNVSFGCWLEAKLRNIMNIHRRKAVSSNVWASSIWRPIWSATHKKKVQSGRNFFVSKTTIFVCRLVRKLFVPLSSPLQCHWSLLQGNKISSPILKNLRGKISSPKTRNVVAQTLLATWMKTLGNEQIPLHSQILLMKQLCSKISPI